MESLFTDLFSTADKSAWLAQVQQELANNRTGESTYETLKWHTDEGFVVDPYYTADDLKSLPLETSQSVQKQVPGWLNAPEHQITDEKTDNAAIRDALTGGADALVLDLTSQSERRDGALARLLKGIKLSDTPVFFKTNDSAQLVETLKIIAPYQLRGGLLVDPVARWIQTGKPLSDDYQRMAAVTKSTADSPQFRTICASSHAFHNAGATATQQLAFLLASLTDTYDKLTDEGLAIDELAPKTMVSVSVGTSYFLEIAKLRALRILLARFLASYQSSVISRQSSLFLHCQTSTFYNATTTPYTNLLRATTEAMAAVIGGCDVLTVYPYNSILEKSAVTTDSATAEREFSNRIARNVSVLLKEEGYLDKIADPSAGSYYIENLTNQLVVTAWALFLDVENQGGFTQAFASGFIPDEIERAYQKKVETVRNGQVIVGVTKFRSDEGRVSAKSPIQPGNRLLPDRRLAEPFE